jgi:topoisomerase-4 subunit B
MKIEILDERNDFHDVFHYENGIEAFVEYLNEEKDVLHPVVSFEGESNGIEVDFAFQFNDGYSENVLSFVNNVRTKDGGTHEAGSKTAMTRAFNEYARKVNLLKEKDKNLDGADIREGFTAIVSVRVPEELLQFEGQTKGKLGTSEARSAVDSVVSEHLSYFLEENPETSSLLIKKAIKAYQAREAARKAREEARSGKKRKRSEAVLSGKLTPAQSRNPQRNELYLVEGDSAGGSAKQGRDRRFQAVLPLRGKVINTEKAKLQDIFKNEEINTIIHAVGAGVGADFNLDDINYDKVIIMTDADTDGAHIQVLLLTFFYRYMKPLLEAGKVFIALPPLYKVSKGSGKKEVVEYSWSDDDLQDTIKKVGKGYMIQRYKGLGEMNADQLWETTMDPETRTLIRVKIDDAARAERRITTLMGDKVEPRRKWIESNVAFGLEEDGSILENENISVLEEEAES